MALLLSLLDCEGCLQIEPQMCENCTPTLNIVFRDSLSKVDLFETNEYAIKDMRFYLSEGGTLEYDVDTLQIGVIQSNLFQIKFRQGKSWRDCEFDNYGLPVTFYISYGNEIDTLQFEDYGSFYDNVRLNNSLDMVAPDSYGGCLMPLVIYK
jgi:hypothetical protein